MKKPSEELKFLVSCMEEDFVPFAEAVMNDIEVIHKKRIFQNAKDSTDNADIGAYRSNWKKARQNAGFQTTRKDYSFTGGLEKSIEVRREGQTIVYGIEDALYQDIADGLEAQDNKEVFKISPNEELLIDDLLFTKLDNAFNECFNI